LSEIEADGLGVSFFGLYPQLCVCFFSVILSLSLFSPFWWLEASFAVSLALVSVR